VPDTVRIAIPEKIRRNGRRPIRWKGPHDWQPEQIHSLQHSRDEQRVTLGQLDTSCRKSRICVCIERPVVISTWPSGYHDPQWTACWRKFRRLRVCFAPRIRRSPEGCGDHIDERGFSGTMINGIRQPQASDHRATTDWTGHSEHSIANANGPAGLPPARHIKALVPGSSQRYTETRPTDPPRSPDRGDQHDQIGGKARCFIARHIAMSECPPTSAPEHIGHAILSAAKNAQRRHDVPTATLYPRVHDRLCHSRAK